MYDNSMAYRVVHNGTVLAAFRYVDEAQTYYYKVRDRYSGDVELQWYIQATDSWKEYVR